MVQIPVQSRRKIVAQLLINEHQWGVPHPVDDYGLYPVLAGDTLECLDYEALCALYRREPYLYLESVTVDDNRVYTLNLVEYRTNSQRTLLGQPPLDLTHYDITPHPIRYQAKHGEYTLMRFDDRYVTAK